MLARLDDKVTKLRLICRYNPGSMVLCLFIKSSSLGGDRDIWVALPTQANANVANISANLGSFVEY